MTADKATPEGDRKRRELRRVTLASEADRRVVAAFLGGSDAAGTPTLCPTWICI